MHGAESYYFAGSKVGCLCIHGFTANPSETRWMGEHLAAQGMTVYGVRLAGHGTHPHDMARTRWQDWYSSARDAYALLRSQCDQVCVVGHSMGGLLGLLLATQTDLTALAVLASPITFPARIRQTRWLRYLRPFTDQSDKSELQYVIREEQARRGEAVIGRVRYDQWSTAALYQLYLLSVHTHAQLAAVKAPLLLLYSTADPTVPYEQARLIADGVSSSVVEQKTLFQSGHILPQDCERDLVFATVADFVRRHTKGT
jgi:carboxylesterase